jgi:hypothetical protein
VRVFAQGAKPSAATPQGTTVLMHAVANGSVPIVAHLLGAGAEPASRDRSGASALTFAASIALPSSVELLKLLVTAGAPIDAADTQPRPAECLQAQTFTHLPKPADDGSLRCVQARGTHLIPSRPIASLDGGSLRRVQGSTALIVGAAARRVDVVDALLELGANVDAGASRLVSIRPALLGRAPSVCVMISCLLAVGCCLLVGPLGTPHRLTFRSTLCARAVDAEGMSALMEASRAADGFEVAERLIAAKASLDGFSKAGFTPLSLAAGAANGPVVALLLKNGTCWAP